MSLVGWVAFHSGLPSFYAVGSGEIIAESALFGWDFPRLVAKVDGSVLVSDAGAGVGETITYRFGSDEISLTRRGTDMSVVDEHEWVTTHDGQSIADVSLLGSDERAYETDATVFVGVNGVRIPRYPLAAPSPTGTLEMSTVGAGTMTLRALVDAKAPLWVVHNARACQVPGCDIEGARLVVPTSMRESRSARRDVAARLWTVDYVRVPDSLGDLGGSPATGVPVVTWGQWEKWGGSQFDPLQIFEENGQLYFVEA